MRDERKKYGKRPFEQFYFASSGNIEESFINIFLLIFPLHAEGILLYEPFGMVIILTSFQLQHSRGYSRCKFIKGFMNLLREMKRESIIPRFNATKVEEETIEKEIEIKRVYIFSRVETAERIKLPDVH
ncbi:hypothetical protein KQX54_013173 [Cotesia glomerata]|uniref:Uncharacterized protein n=1 Tax=Cotesia glomerata TaxID=32391 RepID=A0AAV7J481_COTGL|nr:hypothetical protein KQX54_013173 [Cotesia glomerata]